MIRLSYWITPVFGGIVWLATLLALLLYWIVSADRTHYSSMSEGQTIAYISDVGASNLKPLFIAGCCITTVLLDLSFGFDRWLRHRGRLAPNTTTGEKILSGLTIVFAIVGTVGLILLSIFDTARYPKQHDIFLLLFIAGYVLSAIFICWEYWRLGKTHRETRILRYSFYVKVIFIIIEVVLAIAFIASNFTKHYNPAAILEWVIAFIFSAYVFSFYIDLYPAAANKQQLEVSKGAGGHGLHMRLTRGREREREKPRRYDAAGEMEEGGSERTLRGSNGVASFEGDRVQHGRRSRSRSRVMASNF
ncbi:Frag1/DRAM/Sfk1 family-domain-containing protein [Chaetomium strumarium]|uniref:Frag1/DRAM/Sfk1 family-domain-containing protein n=1 Tax=Chaetomium strumarium TaxID=1170767 RepID=A0AAJ0GXS9_9PEZI|nr:Frag1/DRAM/Sfk1 family-domain-containing protein [Chaetomium strumarium]